MPDGQAGLPALTPFDATCRPRAASIVEDEPQWRWRSGGSISASAAPRVAATRWKTIGRMHDVSAETPNDCYIVGLVLQKMDCRFAVSGRTVVDGVAAPGMLFVTEPAAPCRCVFRGRGESLHLHVPISLVAECSEEISDNQYTTLRCEPMLTRDPVIERLALALLGADDVGDHFATLFADSINVAIIARLLASSRRLQFSQREKVTALPKWRLKRAVEYIETRLAEPMTLADIASVTGLTRMHFAAQFRAATGLRPHEYLLRRRIERAQERLATADAELVDVAASVGFKTQSHFTVVFKRFVGQPPDAWRRLMLER